MKLRSYFILFLTAAIWGVAFVAQSVAMDSIGPFTFYFCRSLLGGSVLIPVIAVLRHNSGVSGQDAVGSKKLLLIAGLSCGTALCVASLFQQFGIMYTSVGKSGFLTACYILIVPIMGIFLGKRCGKLVWCGVGLALVGLYLLCMGGGLAISKGDLLTLICAVMFSVQILLVDHFAPLTDNVMLSCLQFFVGALISGVCMLIFESPDISAILKAWQPILYAGIMSTGVAYTLQIIGQKGANPTVASLIMSLESVVSVIAGWLILGQSLSLRELIGCVFMFAAITLSQLGEKSGPAAG